MELIDNLEEIFTKDTRYHNINDIKRALNIKGEENFDDLKHSLDKLVNEGYLYYDKKIGYKIFPKDQGLAFGEFQLNKNGTGFVHTNDGHTILIENNDFLGALNGDKVIVSNISNNRKDYFSGKINKVVKRLNGNVILKVINNNGIKEVVPYNYLENIKVNIPKYMINDLLIGEVILVNVTNIEYNGIYDGTIIKKLGYIDDSDIEVRSVLEKYNIPIDFSTDVLKEVNKIKTKVDSTDLENRVDLRNMNIFTIDCDNTKDRDDSIGIKKLSNGNYILYVNIADVSYYIKPGMKLFECACTRCFSHYPANTVIPMLPSEISNGICSLNPGVDRLTKTVEMEINNKGDVVNYKIYNSIINSKMAMSYSNVNKVLNNEYIQTYDKYKNDLFLMKELNDILVKSREKRNYINFDTIEENIIKDKFGNITGFEKNDYGTSGNIIENFMVLANTTYYSHFSWFTLGYRVHEVPDINKVSEVLNTLRKSNINIPNIKNIDSKSIKLIIDNLDNSELSNIVKYWLLRSMKKARYDINNSGHFALQIPIYGHFTSPIRRIPDLVAHTVFDMVDTFDYNEESIKEFEVFMQDICKRANEIEKLDKIIEDEILEINMAKYMLNHIGDEYEAYIIDINKNSMMVRTNNLIRGKIKLDNIYDDKYYYDYDSKAVIGRSNKNKYQIGNKVIVLCKDVKKEIGAVYFEIPKQKKLSI